MPKAFKDYLSKDLFSELSRNLKKEYKSFDSSHFLKSVFDDEWSDKELKERTRHITLKLGESLPNDFSKSSSILLGFQKQLERTNHNLVGIELMFLPDYYEVFGIDHFDESLDAMKSITSLISCEFAVRPFIIKYADKMMDVMQKWSLDDDLHVRRLSSEGCRPRLPWGMALPEYKKDPSPIIPILQNLRNDDSEYVRRSVANNLNDIAKDHPNLVLKISKSWMGKNEETDKLVKHAMRSLLKRNYPGSMELFGYADHKKIHFSNFQIHTPVVAIGENVLFEFRIKNCSEKNEAVRIEYAVHFLLSNGRHTKKVFKISERLMKVGEKFDIKRHHSFRKITTRTYYPGKHFISVIINGNEKKEKVFVLNEATH